MRRASAIAAVLGLLFALNPGGSDACVPASQGDHECCAVTAAPPVATCCPGATEPGSVTGFDCDCDHPPDSTTTAPHGTRAPERDDTPSVHRADDSKAAPGPSAALEGASNAPRGQPPPPLFLLDCAFLI